MCVTACFINIILIIFQHFYFLKIVRFSFACSGFSGHLCISPSLFISISHPFFLIYLSPSHSRTLILVLTPGWLAILCLTVFHHRFLATHLLPIFPSISSALLTCLSGPHLRAPLRASRLSEQVLIGENVRRGKEEKTYDCSLDNLRILLTLASFRTVRITLFLIRNKPCVQIRGGNPHAIYRLNHAPTHPRTHPLALTYIPSRPDALCRFTLCTPFVVFLRSTKFPQRVCVCVFGKAHTHSKSKVTHLLKGEQQTTKQKVTHVLFS